MQLPAGLTDIALMCFDIDGTLAAADHRPTPRTLAAIKDLAATGVRVVVITGRALPEALAVLQGGGVDGTAIASNGAIVADASGRVLERTTLDPDLVHAALDFAVGRELETVLFTDDQHLVAPDSVIADYLREVNPHVETISIDRSAVDVTAVIKVCFVAEPDVLASYDAELRERFPGIVQSMTTIYDLPPAGADKGASLGAFLEHHSIDPARVAAVGDSENDLSMLQLVGHPIAVSNAQPRVKDLATFEIGHHDEEAVAELVEAIVAARRA